MQPAQAALSSRVLRFRRPKASPVLRRCGRIVLFLCVSASVLQSRDLLGEDEFLPQKEKKNAVKIKILLLCK